MSTIDYVTRVYDKDRADVIDETDFEAEFDRIASSFSKAKTDIEALEGYAPAAAASAANAATAEANAATHETNAAASAAAAAASETNVATLAAGFPYKGALNLDPNGGRFGLPATGDNILDRDLDGAGTYDRGLWGDYNGGTINSSDKFINDNSTYGGAGSALGSSMQTLITALGRTSNDGRYGVEFYLIQTKFGTGNASPHAHVTGAYLHTAAPVALNFADLDQYVTAGFWFRRIIDTSQPCVWGSGNASVESIVLDGSELRYDVVGAAGMKFEISDTTWHYAMAIHSIKQGHLTTPWPLYGNAFDVPNAGVQVALPFIVPGKIDVTTRWVSPLPGLGEVLVP